MLGLYFVSVFLSLAFRVIAQEEPSCSTFNIMEKFLTRVLINERKMEELGKRLDKVDEAEQDQAKYLVQKVQELENKLQIVIGKGTPTVAFRAHLSSGAQEMSNGEIIKFDLVELNLGDAYDGTHGIFTAPYNGTYAFSMMIGNPGNKPGACFLKKNHIAIEFAFAGNNGDWDMGGVSTFAHLVVGDEVWVEGERNVFGSGTSDRHHSGFSGALLNLS